MQPSNPTVDPDIVVPLFLDGKHKATVGTFDVISPSTNQRCWLSSSADDEDVSAAIASAGRAFKAWRKTKPRERRNILMRAHDILLSRIEQSREIAQTETGVSGEMFKFEYRLAAELLLFTAGIISTVQGSLPIIDGHESHAMVVQEPYGVVLAIAPWNAPHILGLRACIAPLAAGNTVILKGPELSPRTYHNFVEVLHEAGLPPGCLNTIFHRPSDAACITRQLIEHPSVEKVNFTGSSAVGSVVAGLCGKNLKPCLMELGGKAPAIVCDDADLALAAQMCVFGAFHNSGQICMSTERIIVFESVVQQFKEQLRRVMEARSAQSSLSLQLITVAAVKKNKGLMQDALTKGAKIVYGSISSDEATQSRMGPVIIEDVTTDMEIYANESFGPTASLFVVENDDQAIELANDTQYGLTSAVFTRDLARGFQFARAIVSGAVHINGPTIHDEPILPHGGVKSSGFGRFSGKDCLNEWARTKTITWQEL